MQERNSNKHESKDDYLALARAEEQEPDKNEERRGSEHMWDSREPEPHGGEPECVISTVRESAKGWNGVFESNWRDLVCTSWQTHEALTRRTCRQLTFLIHIFPFRCDSKMWYTANRTESHRILVYKILGVSHGAKQVHGFHSKNRRVCIAFSGMFCTRTNKNLKSCALVIFLNTKHF